MSSIAGARMRLDIKMLGRFQARGHQVTGIRRKDFRGIGLEHAHVAIDDHGWVGHMQLWPDETSASLSGGRSRQSEFASSASCLTTIIVITAESSPFAANVRASGTDEPTLFAAHQQHGQAVHPDRAQGVRSPSQGYQKCGPGSVWAAELPAWIHRCNWHRCHGGTNGKLPVSRLGLFAEHLLRPMNNPHGRDGVLAGCTGEASASVDWVFQISEPDCRDKRRRGARLRPAPYSFRRKSRISRDARLGCSYCRCDCRDQRRHAICGFSD